MSAASETRCTCWARVRQIQPSEDSAARCLHCMLRASVRGFGDSVGPFGAIALSRPVRKPADIVGPIFERRAKPAEPPLNGRELGPGDSLGAVGFSVDQDEHNGRRCFCLLSQESTSSEGAAKVRHR